MTVATTASIIAFAWTGVETSFPTGYPVDQAADLIVTYLNANPGSVVQTLVLNTDYAVAIDATTRLATITPLAMTALGIGGISIERVTSALQTTQFVDGESIPASVLQALFDDAAQRGAEARNRIVGILASQTGGFFIATSGVPALGSGVDGGMAWDAGNQIMYGPRAGGVWPAGVSLMGAAGLGTFHMLATTGAPSNGVGSNGDLAYDSTAHKIYGPKAGGVWPAGVALVGPAGGAGATGATGPAGPTGPPFPGLITGFLPSSMAGTATTASMNISAGSAVDSTAAQTLAKAGVTAWAVSNGNAANGYQGGATLPINSTIHMFVCFGGSGTTLFASTSLASPTLPTGFTTLFRRVFSFKTDGAGAPAPFLASEIQGGALVAHLTTPSLDINALTATTANRTLYAMNVPGGIKVQWLGTLTSQTATTWLLITSPQDDNDFAPGTSFATPLFDFVSQAGSAQPPGFRRVTLTDTSSRIGIRASAANPIYAETIGWIDSRRT